MAADLARYRARLKDARRHLNASQRAMAAAKLATMRSGARTDLQLLADWREVTKTEAAQLLNVGERSVQRARKVLDNGTPEVCDVAMAEDREDSRRAP